MKNISIENSFILDEKKCDLVILPLYLVPNIKDDPIIHELIETYLSNHSEEIFKKKHTPGTRIELYSPISEKNYWLYVIPVNMDNFIPSLMIQIQTDISDSFFKNIAISEFGIREYAFKETDLLPLQKLFWEKFSENEPKKNIIFYLVDDNHRPHDSEAKEDEELQDGKPSLGPSIKVERNEVIINEKKVENYLDYFRQYIQKRTENKDYIHSSLINTIYDMKDFLKVACQNFTLVTHKRLNHSKWSHTYKDKKHKHYCQAPCKQTLKYLVLLLDMSEAEAKACFNFFGYGLSAFNREDVLFLRVLRNWDRPLDIDAIDKTLRHYYGKKASLYYTGK